MGHCRHADRDRPTDRPTKPATMIDPTDFYLLFISRAAYLNIFGRADSFCRSELIRVTFAPLHRNAFWRVSATEMNYSDMQ